MSDERGHPSYDINDTERIAVQNIGNDDSTYTAEPPMADHTHTLPSPYPRVNKSSSIVNKSSATHSTTSQGSSRDGSSYQQTESRHLVANPQNTDSHAEQNRELQVQSSMGYKYLNQQFSNDEAVPARGDFTRTPMVAAPFESLKSKITASETPNTDEQYLQDVVEPTPLVLSAPLNDPSTSTTRLPAFNVISNRSSYQQTGSHTPFPIQHSVPLAFQNHPVPTSNSQVGDPRETSDPDSDFGEERQSVYHPFSINDNSSTIHWLPTRIHVSSLRNTVSPTNQNQPIPDAFEKLQRVNKSSSIVNKSSAAHSTSSQCSSRDERSYQQTSESSHLVAIPQNTDLLAKQNREPQVQSSILYKHLTEKVADDAAYRARRDFTKIPNEEVLVGSLKSKITIAATPNIDAQCSQDVVEPMPVRAPPNYPPTHFPQQTHSVNESPATHSSAPRGSSLYGSAYRQTRPHDSVEMQSINSHEKHNCPEERLPRKRYSQPSASHCGDTAGRGGLTRLPTAVTPSGSKYAKITSETPNTHALRSQDVVGSTPFVQSAPLNDPSSNLRPRSDEYPQQCREVANLHYGCQDSSTTQQSSKGRESSPDLDQQQIIMQIVNLFSTVNQSSATHSNVSQGAPQNPVFESSSVTTDQTYSSSTNMDFDVEPNEFRPMPNT